MNKKFWKRRNKNSLQADVDTESTAENSEIRSSDSNSSPVVLQRPLVEDNKEDEMVPQTTNDVTAIEDNTATVLQRPLVEDNKEDEMVPQTTNDVTAIEDNTATNPDGDVSSEKTLCAALNPDMFVAQRTAAKCYKSFTGSVYAVAACMDNVLVFATNTLCKEDGHVHLHNND